MTALPLLLAASLGAFDADAALRHARALAALGPHPFGSPRAQAAASYVAAQLREAGLSEVRLQPFEGDGRAGQNAIGVLKGARPEFVLVAAHHDSTLDSPDRAGAGVLIELARTLARAGEPKRTLVFASFDGRGNESASGPKAAGSRAYVRSLGASARGLIAALVIEASGRRQDTPTLHALAYPDPLRPGSFVVAPAWLVRAVLEGGRRAGFTPVLGQPGLGLLYQPFVRTFEIRLYVDDLSFLQAGLPAVLVSDSPLTRTFGSAALAGDGALVLDSVALRALGSAALGAVAELLAVPSEPEAERTWYAAGGHVLGPYALTLLALVSLLPGLGRARGARGGRILALLAHASAFTLLTWRHPIPALFSLVGPNLAAPLVRSRLWLLSFAPGALLALGGAVAWLRAAGPGGPVIAGSWLSSLDLLLLAFAVLALWLARPSLGAPARRKGREPGRKRRQVRSRSGVERS